VSDLRDLYQETILDHGRKPRNFQILEHATNSADGYNPLCGDKCTVYLALDDGKVNDISFQGSGCAISTASASLMTQFLKGKSLDEARLIFEQFHRLIVGTQSPEDSMETLGKLAVFAGVCEYPSRVKCATLPWHTFNAALENPGEVVSTE
jgi:nitrogen fixation NifU-like protein